MKDLLRSAAVVFALDVVTFAATPTSTAGEKPAAPKPPATRPAAPAPAAAADPAHLAAERMQKFYEATKDLHARFEQEQTSPVTGTRKASGEVFLKKPGRMRWEYTKPDKKLMLADGKTLWVYEPDDEQAFKHDLKSSSLPSSVAFLFGEGRLADEFEITLAQPDARRPLAPGDLLLRLIPKKATAQYHHLEFVVDGKSYMVKETVVYDQQAGQNRMRFADVTTNQGVSDGKFSFTPPPGTRILKP